MPAIIEDRLPTTDDYARLRKAVGWSVPDVAACATALARSAGGACATESGRVVGMGRLVGDGTLYLWIVDLIVDPSHQRGGIGRALVRSLEEVAREYSGSRTVSIVAAPRVENFYERLGFERSGSALLVKHL